MLSLVYPTIQLLLRPSPLSQRHLHSCSCTTAILFSPPGPVFSQPDLGVRGIVKVYLRDGRLYQSPDAPIEAWDTAERLDLFEYAIDICALLFPRPVSGVVRYVFIDESSTCGASRKSAMVAIEAAPFGKVVGYVESCWGRYGVFVVDERYGLDLRIPVDDGTRLNNHISTEEVGMAKD